MKKRLVFLIFLNSWILCFGQAEIDLNQYFTPAEIQDLEKMTAFVQKELCGARNSSDFGQCIQKSLPDLADLEQSYVLDKISWKKQKKLYANFSPTTFNKIWNLCQFWKNTEPIIEFKSLCFSLDENFIDFMKSVGKSNPYILDYAKRLEAVGSFDSGFYFVWNIRDNPENWNLDDPHVQYIIAIQLLTQNDQQKRNKKINRIDKREVRRMNRASKRWSRG
jgi:hypothetical protein